MSKCDSFNKNCNSIIKFILNEDKAFFHYETEFTEVEYMVLIAEVTESVKNAIITDTASKQLIMKYSSFLLDTINKTKLIASKTIEEMQKKHWGQKLNARKIRDAQMLNNLLLNGFRSHTLEEFEILKMVALNKEESCDSSATIIRWLMKNNILSKVDTNQVINELKAGRDLIECLVEQRVEPKCRNCGNVYEINKTNIKRDSCKKCNKAVSSVKCNTGVKDKKIERDNVIKSINTIENRINAYKSIDIVEDKSYGFIMYETYINTIQSNLSNIESINISMLTDIEKQEVTEGIRALKTRLKKMEEKLNESIKE